MRSLVVSLSLFLAFVSPVGAAALVTLATDSAELTLNADGSLGSLVRKDRPGNLLAPGQPAPVLSLRIEGQIHTPDEASWDSAGQRLTLRFHEAHAKAIVSVTAKRTHWVLELQEVEPSERVELAWWGPYPTAIRETVGEIVGVVRDRETAIGIQALNAKTLGGSPAVENDIDHEFGADDTGSYPDLPRELQQGQGFRGDTARATPFGSVLQAYCRQRHRDRIIPNWGHEKYRVAAFPDGGVIGSRIALFAGLESQALATIGAIEVAEGLPHPLLDGQWAKLTPGATASYLIVDFGEETVDRAIEMTRRAGLKYLYHSSPFATWGHFTLKPALFPHGWDGFGTCVERAQRAGIRLGFHTLSNFITPNDAYVTPDPDPRLAVVGGSTLVAAIEVSTREIPVENAEYFSAKSTLNTVRVGQELVRFSSVSPQAPWRLLDCERGAWGTQAAAHSSGVPVERLLDHEYKVFLADAGLSQEIARRIASFCNQTGARQLSFDGLEGAWSTGYGQYGRTLFTKAWYDALDDSTRGQVINDASNPGHFNWHINTRMNWGEPWYAGFRESQTLYRFKNQVLFERNFMPHMLGWFALRPNTTLEDAEWLLARAAGFQAGFALATSLASTAQLEADPDSANTARQFGSTTAILGTLAQWETARLAGAFPPAIRAQLRDNQREFHLQSVGEGRWDLREVYVTRLNDSNASGAAATFPFSNRGEAQPLQWIVRAPEKSPVNHLRLMVNARPVLDLANMTVPPGGSVRYPGGAYAAIVDASGKQVSQAQVAEAEARVDSGASTFDVQAELPAEANLKLELRTLSPATRIQKP